MTSMNIAMTTLLNGICLGAILAAAMMLLLKLFPRLNPTTRFTVLWMTLLAVVALLATPLTPRPSSRSLESSRSSLFPQVRRESPHLRRHQSTDRDARLMHPTSTRLRRRALRQHPSKVWKHHFLKTPP
jgi:hypothetical protein